jgi:hypothetical protein
MEELKVMQAEMGAMMKTLSALASSTQEIHTKVTEGSVRDEYFKEALVGLHNRMDDHEERVDRRFSVRDKVVFGVLTGWGVVIFGFILNRVS